MESADFKRGVRLLKRENDSAFYFFNKVAASSADSLEVARALNYMGRIQLGAGDLFGSQESLLASLGLLKERDTSNTKCIASNYNVLGMTKFSLKEYPAAIDYFELAYQLQPPDSLRDRFTILNNKAMAYRMTGSYAKALDIWRNALRQGISNKLLYAQVLANFASTKWLQHSEYRAAPELLEALSIRQKYGDQRDLNSSYAHLADYYTLSRPDSALQYAQLMYAVAVRLKSPDDQVEALQKLITLSRPEKVKPYFDRYLQLTDSIQTTRNAAKNQFALIRYGAEKNKADNLRLKQENLRQSVLLGGTGLLVLAGALFAGFWYKKRKQQMELEKTNAVQESRLKASKKVHDVVANGLYRVMSEVQFQDDLGKDDLLDKIEVLYEQSRDIFDDKPAAPGRTFHQVLSELFLSFEADQLQLEVSGNSASLWNPVSPAVCEELLNVLQELLVNMRKHSRASRVDVRFSTAAGRIHLHYSDDGVGLPNPIPYGNGIRNTENRIKAIRGSITFGSTGTGGLDVQIDFPQA